MVQTGPDPNRNKVGTTEGVCNCPACVCNLPAKFKDLHTRRGMQTSKVKRYTVITDGEDKERPPKKKPKTSLLEKLDTETGHISLDEGPKQMNTHVFSQVSEDAQDTCENTEVCCLDDSEDVLARETSTSGKGGVSDR